MRSHRSGERDILFIGTDEEWLETLEWLWAQPKLPTKLARLEAVLLYHYGADALADHLDSEVAERRLETWKAHVTWTPKKKPWWRFW